MPTYLDFIRYFYCVCLTRPPDVLARFRNLAGATQRIKIDKIESQVTSAEEAYHLNREQRYTLQYFLALAMQSIKYKAILSNYQ